MGANMLMIVNSRQQLPLIDRNRPLFDVMTLSIMRLPNFQTGVETVCRLKIFIGTY